MTMAQNDEFAARLKRINAGKTTAWTVPGEGLASRGQEGRIVQKEMNAATKRARKGGIFLVPLAVVTGTVSAVAGRWLAFTYLGADGPLGVDLAELGLPVAPEMAVAALLSVIFVLIFSLTTKMRALVHLAALGVAMAYENELVHLAPDLYAMLYPDTWVASMLAVPSQLPV